MKETQSTRFQEVVECIDYVLLEPQLSEKETLEGCFLAIKLKVRSVIVKPCYVKQAVNVLKGSSVSVGTVVGFPLGANTTYVKVAEVKRALTEGAKEIELMINAGYVNDKTNDLVHRDIQAVCGIAHMNGVEVNVILPLGSLTEQQIIRSAIIASEAGANGVTISSGLISSEDLIRKVKTVIDSIGGTIPIKIMGEFTSGPKFLAMIATGCQRIGVEDLDHLHRLFETEVL